MMIPSLSVVRTMAVREHNDFNLMQDATTKLSQAQDPVMALSAKSEFATAQNDVARQAGSILNIVA